MTHSLSFFCFLSAMKAGIIGFFTRQIEGMPNGIHHAWHVGFLNEDREEYFIREMARYSPAKSEKDAESIRYVQELYRINNFLSELFDLDKRNTPVANVVDFYTKRDGRFLRLAIEMDDAKRAAGYGGVRHKALDMLVTKGLVDHKSINALSPEQHERLCGFMNTAGQH